MQCHLSHSLNKSVPYPAAELVKKLPKTLPAPRAQTSIHNQDAWFPLVCISEGADWHQLLYWEWVHLCAIQPLLSDATELIGEAKNTPRQLEICTSAHAFWNLKDIKWGVFLIYIWKQAFDVHTMMKESGGIEQRTNANEKNKNQRPTPFLVTLVQGATLWKAVEKQQPWIQLHFI